MGKSRCKEERRQRLYIIGLRLNGLVQIIARNHKGFFDRAKPYIYFDSFCVVLPEGAGVKGEWVCKV